MMTFERCAKAGRESGLSTSAEAQWSLGLLAAGKLSLSEPAHCKNFFFFIRCLTPSFESSGLLNDVFSTLLGLEYRLPNF
jgi:hypothetical protein